MAFFPNRVGRRAHSRLEKSKREIALNWFENKMIRLITSLLLMMTLVACETTQSSGGGIPKLGDPATVRFRHVDSVNALRASRGLAETTLSATLSAAAATHARDMSVQKRAWHFGSDRSSPVSRARRAGFGGTVLSENISESFDDEFEVIQNWLNDPQAFAAMMNPLASEIGLGWFQEPGGKIWWVQVLGGAVRTTSALRL